jgi:hypothetical protein
MREEKSRMAKGTGPRTGAWEKIKSRSKIKIKKRIKSKFRMALAAGQRSTG